MIIGLSHEIPKRNTYMHIKYEYHITKIYPSRYCFGRLDDTDCYRLVLEGGQLEVWHDWLRFRTPVSFLEWHLVDWRFQRKVELKFL